MTDSVISIICSAAALHDIGKIAIPDSVLLKPGRLTDEEMERFFELNPDFMEEYCMYRERLKLLRDKMYREILRGIYKK